MLSYKTDVIQHGTANLDPRQWASGVNSLSQQYNVFCAGVKTCKFLYKYDDSMWADTDNYYSEFSDIKFKNAATYFISSLKLIMTFHIVRDGKKVKIFIME